MLCLQVQKDFVVLDSVSITDPNKSAAQSTTFWQDCDKPKIKGGVTTLWEQKSLLNTGQLQLPVPPGALRKQQQKKKTRATAN